MTPPFPGGSGGPGRPGPGGPRRNAGPWRDSGAERPGRDRRAPPPRGPSGQGFPAPRPTPERRPEARRDPPPPSVSEDERASSDAGNVQGWDALAGAAEVDFDFAQAPSAALGSGAQRGSPEGRLVVGLQPVRELIRVHGRAVERVAIDDRPEPRLDALARFASDQGVRRVERVGRGQLDSVSGGTAHQGVVGWGPELSLRPAEEILADGSLMAIGLDGIQDPQNFGAVVRSAVGVAGAAVVWGEHGSAPLTPSTFRASAGAIEHARLCRVTSLPGFVDEALAQGVQVVGLDAQASATLADLDLTRPTLLLLGSEHRGLARGLRKKCSSLARLSDLGTIDSLNASVAAGIALYEAWKQRSKTRG